MGEQEEEEANIEPTHTRTVIGEIHKRHLLLLWRWNKFTFLNSLGLGTNINLDKLLAYA